MSLKIVGTKSGGVEWAFTKKTRRIQIFFWKILKYYFYCSFPYCEVIRENLVISTRRFRSFFSFYTFLNFQSRMENLRRYFHIYIYILIIFHYIPDNISLSSYLQWKKRSTKRDKNSPIWEIFLPAKSIPIYKFTQTFFSVRRSAKFLTYTSRVFTFWQGLWSTSHVLRIREF